MIIEIRLHQGSSSRDLVWDPESFSLFSWRKKKPDLHLRNHFRSRTWRSWVPCIIFDVTAFTFKIRGKVFPPPKLRLGKPAKNYLYTNHESRSTKVGNKHCLLNEGFPNWPMIVPIMGSKASQIIINQSTSLCFLAQWLQHLLEWLSLIAREIWICSHGRNWSCQIWIVVAIDWFCPWAPY